MQQFILRLGVVERHVAGVHVSDVSQNSEIDRIKDGWSASSGGSS